MNSRKSFKTEQLRRTALALALGMGVTGLAFAQATTGTIFGQAPTGDTVLVKSLNSGTSREVTVDASGRYAVSHLPLGTYTVTLRKDGAQVANRENVAINVGAGTDVSFAGGASEQNAQQMEGLTVTANSLPTIDVTSVNSSTIITAKDLATLPLQRNAESIALLAPGTVAGSGYFGNAVSFGGSSVTENAYYVNGYNTTEPYRNTGGFQLPYGAIEQQETLTGGYSAKYGRSDGGVINQVGKRGTNEWHFGAMVSWQPRSTSANPFNTYYGNKAVPEGYGLDNPDLVGTMKRYRQDNKKWETVYSAYLGGPLIQDKLYFFLAADQTKDKATDVGDVDAGTIAYNTSRYQNIYTKVDWNITDNNIVELTYLKRSQSENRGATYDFDYDTLKPGDFEAGNDVSKDSGKFFIGNYTGYLTDDLTLNVTYGKGDFANPYVYSNPSVNAALSGATTNSNPAYWVNGNPPHNDQPGFYRYLPGAANNTHGLRADLSYRVGSHDIGVGIDNMSYSATDQGQTMSGPGYAWIYSHTANPGSSPNPTFGIAPPGGQGYYVQRYIFSVATSMTMSQKAYYLQDVWGITDRFQLNLGVRNDHFTNYNDLGRAFVDEKNQWEPRVGFSWDVNGDSSFKLYGNAGRYYLALPDNVAERAANRSTYTREYFNYSGIDANGNPTGLTSLGPITSADAEYGQAKDPKQVAASNLDAQYQDEFILGFDKTLGDKWVYGAKATYRELKTAIDDNCDVGSIVTKVEAMGLDANDYSQQLLNPQTLLGCRIFNPGETNTFNIAKDDGTGYTSVSMSNADWRYTSGAKRKYYALNLYMEHPFDGKWQARVDYTFGKSYGNTEGQVKSDIGQADISKTQDWDSAELMENASGLLANDRRHSIRVRGSYQITPEWLVSGSLLAQSGSPRECYGYYGVENGDPIGYANSYHYCFGQPSPPGKQGHTPWTENLSLGVHYSPAFADHKLGFHADVFNALNQQRALQVDPVGSSNPFTVSNTYGDGLYYQTPRYVRFSVTYDY